MGSKSGTATPPTTNSGIITDELTGQRHIPASVRADGSTRKEIKIRPGYRPAEDVEVYRNRAAHAYQTRGTGGIPGAEGLKDDDETKNSGEKLNKNTKRREAKKKAKSEAADGIAEADEGPATQGQSEAKTEAVQEPALSKEDQEKVEKDKKVRKLKKKLREARELQEKKEKGETLLHEQFEKVIKINELIRDLDKLGFDAQGEPKGESQN